MNPTILFVRSLFILLISFTLFTCQPKKEEWQDLFNGNDLTGWRSNESDESFHVEDGMIVASGPRSHLFYVGDGKEEPNFKNFELTADIMTTHLANSGIYFHTKWQDEGWPEKGYEAQVNVSHIGAGDYKEVKKGGSLYAVRNTYKALARDSAWYTMRVRVEGKKIRIWMDDVLTVDYVEPQHLARFRAEGQDVLSGGTFALQCHDPDSKVFYKNVRIKVLPDVPSQEEAVGEDNYQDILQLQSEHFPMMDLDVVTDGQFNVDSALSVFYSSGINLGFVADLSETDGGIAMEILNSHVQSFKRYPVFLGAKISLLVDRPFVELPSGIDYLIGEFLLEMEEGFIDKNNFMDSYVMELIASIQGSGIDIFANPTRLPSELAPEYEELWDRERMMKVIQALNENDIAIEINNELRVPGLDFIKLAKENGCKFSCGHISNDKGVAKYNYLLEAIEYAQLNYKDIFIPGNM